MRTASDPPVCHDLSENQGCWRNPGDPGLADSLQLEKRRLEMNRIRVAVALLILAMSLVGCASADLVVTSWQSTGAPTINSQNSVEVPVRAVVRNQGGAAANLFKVAAEYTGSQGKFVVAFTVPGQSDFWYPHTTMSLAVGSDATFDGKLTFHPALHGETVSLMATADSCSGDEFMPDYCRVNESDEGNNASTAISVTLP